MLTPFPPQVDCIDAMVESLTHNRVVLNTSQCGCGKTLMAIETCKRMGLHPIVITPASVVTSWQRSLDEQEWDYYDILSWEKMKQGKTQWYKAPLKSKRLMYGIWNLPKNAILIFDEVHKGKSYKSQNNIMVLSAVRQNIPMIMLSATPFVTPLDMSAIAYATKLMADPRSFHTWCIRNGCTNCFWGGLEFKPKNRHYLEDINKQLRDKRVMVSVPIESIASHFKRDTLIPYAVNVDTKTVRAIKALEAYINKIDKAWLESVDRAEEKGEDVSGAVELIRLRQQVEMNKIPYIFEKVSELLDSGYSVVVFLSYIDSINALADMLNAPHVQITGRMSRTKIQEGIDRFQADEINLALVQIASGGAGISLNDTKGNHPRASLINPDYSIVNLEQARGRINRLGSKSDTLQYIVTAVGTVEEKIAKTLIDKQNNLNTLIK